MHKIMYFDASNGVSGDMFVGAMLDMGADFEAIKADVMSLGLDIELKAEKADSHGITATKFSVIDKTTGYHADDEHHHNHEHRHLSDIRELIEKSPLNKTVKDAAIKIFQMIAEAEAKVHGADIESVHFHEVGALDSIADIVAAASAFYQFNVKRSFSSFINTGSGTVKCQHGVLPVPAPAVLQLLKGMSSYSDGTMTELATPTGVALLKYFCDDFIDMPRIKIETIGNGAGSRDIGRPNIFRSIIGESSL